MALGRVLRICEHIQQTDTVLDWGQDLALLGLIDGEFELSFWVRNNVVPDMK